MPRSTKSCSRDPLPEAVSVMNPSGKDTVTGPPVGRNPSVNRSPCRVICVFVALVIDARIGGLSPTENPEPPGVVMSKSAR